MNKNKKCLAVLSSAALGVLIASAVTSTASAKTTAYVAKDATGKVISFDLTKLVADYTNNMSKLPSPMFDEYMKDVAKLVAFQDDKTGLVSYDSVLKVYTDDMAAGKPFVLDTVTEAAKDADLAKDVTVGYTCDDKGAVNAVDPTKQVVSVVPITATTNAGTVATLPTTVKATLGDKTTVDAKITWNAAATAAATYATAGTVTVNGTLADYGNYAVSGTVTVNAVPKDLAVQSVTALNARQIQVVFNKEVAKVSAEDETNYSFAAANNDAKTVSLIATTGAELQSDNKTVILTLNSTLNAKTTASYLVRISKVTDVDGTKTQEYSQLLSLFDNAVPTITGVSYPDSDTVKVSFSEPVDTTSLGVSSATTIKQDGVTKVVLPSAFTLADDKKSFNISISASGLTRGKDYSISIKGLSDFALNPLTQYDGTMSLATDSENPSVVSLEAMDLQRLKVTFSEKIKGATGTPGTLLGITTPDGKTLTKVEDADTTTPDGKTFILTLSAAYNDNDAKLITINNYQDMSNNPTNKAESTYSKLVTFHKVLPTVTSSAATVRKIGDDYYAVLAFDRDVKIAGTTKTMTTTYVDSQSITKTPTAFTTVSGASRTIFGKAELANLASNEIALKLTGAVTYPSGNYTVDFTDGVVTDTAGNPVAAKTGAATFTYTQSAVTQKVNAVVSNKATGEQTSLTGTLAKTTDNNTVYVQFTGDVGTDALNPDHYTLDGAKVFKSAIFDGAASIVKLTLNDGAITSNAAKTMTISGIAGVEDTTIYKDQATAQAESSTAAYFNANVKFIENVKPTLTSAKLIALDKIQLVYNEDLDDTSADVAANYVIKANGVAQTVNSAVENNGTVILTLNADVPAADSDKVTLTIDPAQQSVAANKLQDVKGNVIDKVDASTITVAFQDLTAIAKAKVDNAYSLLNSDGTLTSGTTLTQFRSAVNDAWTALNSAGLATSTSNIYTAGGNTTYAQAINLLEYDALIQEFEAQAATADLTNADTYAAMITTATTSNLAKINVARTAATGAASTKQAATLTGVKALNDAWFAADGLLGSGYIKDMNDAISAETDAETAVTAAVADNTGAKLGTAVTKIGTADTGITAINSKLAYTKAVLQAKEKVNNDKITTSVANINLVKKGAAGADATTVIATWGSDNASCTLSNLVLSITGTGVTSPAVNGTTGVVN